MLGRGGKGEVVPRPLFFTALFFAYFPNYIFITWKKHDVN